MHVDIHIVPGSTMPKFEGDITELDCAEVVITEQAMQSGLPACDFMCTDRDGNRYFVVLSGRMVNMISAAVRGINTRIHGLQDP